MHVVAALDCAHHGVEAAVTSARQHRHRHQQRNKANGDQQKTSHSGPPFVLSLSLSLLRTPFSTSPRAPRPPIPFSLPRSSMRTGPKISTMESSFGSAERTNIPCVSPLTIFSRTSVVSPDLRSRECTIGVHSLVSKKARSFWISSIEYSPSLSNS